MEEIDVICIDFWKAFDSMPNNELLMKLWNIGITGNLWFNSYVPKQQSPVFSVGNHLSTIIVYLFSLEYPREAYWAPYFLI